MYQRVFYVQYLVITLQSTLLRLLMEVSLSTTGCGDLRGGHQFCLKHRGFGYFAYYFRGPQFLCNLWNQYFIKMFKKPQNNNINTFKYFKHHLLFSPWEGQQFCAVKMTRNRQKCCNIQNKIDSHIPKNVSRETNNTSKRPYWSMWVLWILTKMFWRINVVMGA